jgi:hypothetical protein
MLVVDNYDNNLKGVERVLSDLYACRVPLQVNIVGGAQKKRTVQFASLEHAWCVRRMIRHPHIGVNRSVVTVINMKQEFLTTQEDALCFLAQFEAGGVFASWSSISEYYAVANITTEPKGMHNIGLIARFVCSNHPTADKIRQKIRGFAADRWKSTGDMVARSIACFLWRGPANMTSYKSGLAVVAKAKFANNPEICNALCSTRGISLETTFYGCNMVTVTRKKTSHEYMKTLSRLAESLEWQLSSPMLLVLVMALHPRLGQNSLLARVGLDTFWSILGTIVAPKQAKRLKTFLAKK